MRLGQWIGERLAETMVSLDWRNDNTHLPSSLLEICAHSGKTFDFVILTRLWGFRKCAAICQEEEVGLLRLLE